MQRISMDNTKRAAAIGSPCLHPLVISKSPDIFPTWFIQALKLFNRMLIHFI